MSKQFKSFQEFIQPSDLDYEGPSNLGSPEEDSDPSSESDMGPSQLKFKRRKGETDALKEEIAKLHAKLKRCEEALANTTCLVCGGPSNVNKGLDCRSQVLEAGPNIEKGKSPLEFPEAVQQTRENFCTLRMDKT
ncbi:hypothetical protein M0R45_001582 [Rubus argutus]|uniref:Uncharacterized protein n=1 Tax=Rubus argutus TaxID=59490 RepID=A0AAW1VJH0_RUBAR